MSPQNLSPAFAARPLARLNAVISSSSPSFPRGPYRRSPPCEGGTRCAQSRQQKPPLCGGFKPSPGLEPGAASLPWRWSIRITWATGRHWTGTPSRSCRLFWRLTHSFEIWESELTLSFEIWESGLTPQLRDLGIRADPQLRELRIADLAGTFRRTTVSL